jgi:glycosyltransferase involved in cell wall biosynthesis
MTLGEESVKVSIIITCYNLENYVKDAITSLLNQVCNFSFEIIVIDDASTDRSKEVIAAIKDPRIQVFNLFPSIKMLALLKPLISAFQKQPVNMFAGSMLMINGTLIICKKQQTSWIIILI